MWTFFLFFFLKLAVFAMNGVNVHRAHWGPCILVASIFGGGWNKGSTTEPSGSLTASVFRAQSTSGGSTRVQMPYWQLFFFFFLFFMHCSSSMHGWYAAIFRGLIAVRRGSRWATFNFLGPVIAMHRNDAQGAMTQLVLLNHQEMAIATCRACSS